MSENGKILVAIHGIGDQIRCETVQAVAYQLCHFYGAPASIPLGRFNAALGFNSGVAAPRGAADPAVSAFLLEHPPDPDLPERLGFAEVYWANIPRGPAADRYTLEESKKWARTVVERVRAQDRSRHFAKPRTDEDYRLAGNVIEEMIETTAVLQHLLFLAEKSTFFRFDLNRLLVDFLGDVQVVADFRSLREQILDAFEGVLERTHKKYPGAELYVVAHSEGTVIAFLGILRSLCRLREKRGCGCGGGGQRAWVENLRGFMTIGSPINKHLLLWPELWDGLTNADQSVQLPNPIQWRNYYDFGDPIGFRLDRTREWLRDNQWLSENGSKGCFKFDGEKDDIGFTRYFFPGQAHNEYWWDDGVFGHFLEDVVGLRPAPSPRAREGRRPVPAKQGATNKARFGAPTTRRWPQVVSPTLPFVIAAGLLALGVFLLYKAVVGYTLEFREDVLDVARNVSGITLLLGGVTAAVRIPRLTKHPGWRTGGLAFFAASIVLFPLLPTGAAKDRIGSVFLNRGAALDRVVGILDAAASRLNGRLGIDLKGTTLAILLLTVLGTVVVYLVCRARPLWGAKPLIFFGCAVIFLIVAVRVGDTKPHELLARARGFHAASAPRGERAASGSDVDRQSVHDVNDFVNAECAAGASRPEDLDQRFDDFLRSRHAGTATEVSDQAARRGPQRPRVESDRPVWPIFLSGAAFLYLWWLAALFFDLVVVWHYYIRSSGILDRLSKSPSA